MNRQPSDGSFFAVIHVAVDALTVDFLDGVGEVIGDVFVGRPVDWHAEVVAELLFEAGLDVGALEQVVAEPVQVCELLVGQLIQLAVGERAEGEAHEVGQVEGRTGDVLAALLHEIGERAVDDVVVARMRADEVAIVHPEIVDGAAGLHLDFDLVDEQALVHQVVVDLDAGDVGERPGKGFRLVIVHLQDLGHGAELHALVGFGGGDEPLHLGHLGVFTERGRLEFGVDPFLGGVYLLRVADAAANGDASADDARDCGTLHNIPSFHFTFSLRCLLVKPVETSRPSIELRPRTGTRGFRLRNA